MQALKSFKEFSAVVVYMENSVRRVKLFVYESSVDDFVEEFLLKNQSDTSNIIELVYKNGELVYTSLEADCADLTDEELLEAV